MYRMILMHVRLLCMETRSSVSINMFSLKHVGKIHTKLQCMIIFTKCIEEVTGERNLEMPVLHVTCKERSLYSDLFAEGIEDNVH